MSRSLGIWTLAVSGILALFANNEAWTTGGKEKVFLVVVQRQKTDGDLILGNLTVDGQAIGRVYENAAKKIPAGKYKGILRYSSTRNFVQGPGGKLGKSGDFLLEIANVPKRTDILFHAGNKAEHSEGCILCGPAVKDTKTGEPIAPETLKKLRLLFYDGKDKATSSTNKAIQIVVNDL